jgi:hypothetical protein
VRLTPTKLSSLVGTLTLGTLEAKLALMMMEEVSSQFLKHSDCSSKVDTDPRERSDLSLGVERNQAARSMGLLSMPQLTPINSANTLLLLRATSEAQNYWDSATQVPVKPS